MKTNEGGITKRDEPLKISRAGMLEAAREQRRALLVRLAWGAGLMVALVGAGLLSGGCGGKSGERAASAPQSAQAVAASQSGALVLDTHAAGAPVRETTGATPVSVSEDSLPPDVAATILESRVLPGSVVDIRAEGSPDVVAVTLGDRTGHKQAFTYDADADLWRAAYRVPVRSDGERLALSVTARNASGRWHRVWTFLNVESKPAEVVPADTTQSENK